MRGRAGTPAGARLAGQVALAGLATLVHPGNGLAQHVHEVTQKVVLADTFRVMTRIRNESATFVRIVDRSGVIQFSDSLPSTLMPELRTGQGLQLSVGMPQAPGFQGLTLVLTERGTDRQASRFLVQRGTRLTPVTPWSRMPYWDAERKVHVFQQPTSHFVATVPARIGGERPGGGIELVPDRGAGGLAILEVPGAASFGRLYFPELEDSVFRVRLYRAPEGGALDVVTVTPSTGVTIGRAWAHVDLKRGGPPLRIEWPDVEVRRLEATIAGRRGFVEPADFRALGLTEAVMDGWSSPPTAPRRRFDRVLATVPVPGDTVRVVATMLYPRRGDQWPQTIEWVRLIDGRGRVQYSDSLGPSLSATGAVESENLIAARLVRWSDRPGLRLEWYGSPSDPADPGACRYFVQEGARLIAVAPWSSFCHGPEPGDVIVSETWQGWFGVRIPARVRIGSADARLELIPARDVAHGGLAVLELVDVDSLPHEFFDEDWNAIQGADARLTVRLFRAPTGAAVEHVAVTPSSRVRLGRLYAEVALVPRDDGRGQEIQVTIVRLEVAIDGRRGFVEEGDFPAVGLRQAG